MRAPTRDGLFISPYEYYAVPTEQDINTRGATTNHHVAYEKHSYYQGPRWRSLFRALLPNVYPLLTADHAELHDRFSAPQMPKDGLMLDVLDDYAALHGQLDLVYEKKTRQTWVMDLEQYERIRDGQDAA